MVVDSSEGTTTIVQRIGPPANVEAEIKIYDGPSADILGIEQALEEKSPVVLDALSELLARLLRLET